MNVKFSFDRAIIERQGFTLEDVYRTIKNLFTAHDFPCVSDGDALAFKDKSHGDDFAVMWDIILSLLRSEWFMDCAVSCVWQDEDGEEDVLAQAGKIRDVVRQQSVGNGRFRLPISITLPHGRSPASGGAKALTAGSGEGASIAF